jgi:hypothetical protein
MCSHKSLYESDLASPMSYYVSPAMIDLWLRARAISSPAQSNPLTLTPLNLRTSESGRLAGGGGAGGGPASSGTSLDTPKVRVCRLLLLLLLLQVRECTATCSGF